jgi:hypothetical protein
MKDNKKVISFSLWGDNPKYTKGAEENIRCRNEMLPGWTCRFYVHDTVPNTIVARLEAYEDVEVIRRTGDLGRHMDRPGMFWRFEVMEDPEVDRFIVRDADSRIHQRDANCIRDWVASKRPFHIIRDHRQHTARIMGGMWGATREFARSVDYRKLLKDFENSTYTNMLATDQEFLGRHVYPLAVDRALIHDNWDRFGEGAVKIPHLGGDGTFVGQPVEL